ncbi:MAG: peptidoglycan recognition family protein [Niameybacter sp.]|uniref:peptidoglycan recognition protein family protein n=1 Tax=Niameybacter sp. TaxID=2033640 RepID=UPI002FCBF03B
MHIQIQQHFLTPNPYSRPQIPLTSIKKLVIHWVANPMSSALANRNYFENLKAGTRGFYASSHYIVGLQGEVIQCIPDTERAYHAKNANSYSLGIEVCHQDWEGQFLPPTYESLVNLCATLCMTYTLDPKSDILRHYDVTGKVCPKYYVHHPAHWTKLKADVVASLGTHYLQTQPPHHTSLSLNGTLKQVLAFIVEQQHYVRLRDLADDKIEVGYDAAQKIPTVEVKEK